MAENRVPQEQPRFDPFEAWRQFYEANEQAWTKAIKDVTTTPDYVEAQGRMLETFLAYQKLVRDATSMQLAAFNVPTRDDIGRLGELIVGVEEKVDRLDEAVSKQDGVVNGLAQKMPRIPEKMERIEAQLSKLEEAVVGLSQQMARIERHFAQLASPEERADGATEDGKAVSDRPSRATSGRASRQSARTGEAKD